MVGPSLPNPKPVPADEMRKPLPAMCTPGNPKTTIRYTRNECVNNMPTSNGIPIRLKPALSSTKDMKIVFKNITLTAAKPIRLKKSVAVLPAEAEIVPTLGEPTIKTETIVQPITCSPIKTYSRNAPPNTLHPGMFPIKITKSTNTASVSTSEYRELFAALLKIKDTAFVDRVMAAINGKTVSASQPATEEVKVSTALCSQCGSFNLGPSTRASVSVATQTLELDFQRLNAMTEPKIKRVQQRKRKRFIPHAVKTSEAVDDGGIIDSKNISSAVSDAVRPLVTPVVPPAESPTTSSVSIHTSPASSPSSGIVALKNDIIIGSGALSKPNSINNSYANSPARTPGRFDDSLFNFSLTDYPTPDFLASFFGDSLDAKLDRSNEYTVAERIRQTIAQDLRSLRFDQECGLLPIHAAALNGERKRLMRLVKIFKVLNINLNDQRLLAHDVDESGECLENSILHFAVNCVAPDALAIVQHLLENGTDPLQCNRHDDNVLHYAAQHTDNPAIFEALLNHLESVSDQLLPGTLLTALGAVNQDGQALIHLIVSNRKFDFMVALLAAIDRILQKSAAPGVLEIDGPSHAKKAMMMQQPPAPRSPSVAALLEHIDGFEQYANDFGRLIDPRKAALLNQPDPRTGRTALLRAMLQSDAEPLVLLLLAHHADPRLADMAGVDCAAACAGIAEASANNKIDAGVAGATTDSKTAENTMVAYVQKVWQLRQLMDGTPTRARVLLRQAKRADSEDGNVHVDGLVPLSSSAVIRMSASDQASLLVSTQRPKRPYKKRKIKTEPDTNI